ncbi:hypothetical protein [Mucilaginibacter antarcticus]|uniref:Uncharacterized protein n=1 Tax=Mucilaginibacter antarcticus TaxID=1855725 RepID=A0ABW5XTU7_9SPHI
METVDPRTRKVTTEMVIAKLKEHGQTVTKAEAKIILDFMYKIAILSVNQYVKL